ncbi:MAG: Uma2 family endonuclease [Gemmataceae bacterium]
MNALRAWPGDTVADLLHRLGNVAPDRVVLRPLPGTATVADVVAAGKPACDLIDGTLVRPAVHNLPSFLGACLSTFLMNAVLPANLGIVTNTLAPLELRPGRVRVPSLAFTPWSRLPGRRIPTEPVAAVVPALTVDFYRPGNTPAELSMKRADYFAAGVDLHWLIDGFARLVRVYLPDGDLVTLTAADTLTGEPVLPGFSLRLADLFAELDRHG